MDPSSPNYQYELNRLRIHFQTSQERLRLLEVQSRAEQELFEQARAEAERRHQAEIEAIHRSYQSPTDKGKRRM